MLLRPLIRIPYTRSGSKNFIQCSRRTESISAATKLSNVSIDKTRNIGIVAHIDAGKTTTTETMLYFSGQTQHIGNVDDGDTVTDYLPSERQRGITIQSAAISIPWNNKKINIIDTPGHADFTFEVVRSLRVLDGAVTVFDAVAGVEAQSEKVWKQAASLGIPRIAFVNKMDRIGAGFSRTVKEMIEKLQTKVVLCNIPYFETSSDGEAHFKGVVDIVAKKIIKWLPEVDPTGQKIEVIDLESESSNKYKEMVKKCRESLVETLGEFDEEIINEFLEKNEDFLSISSSVLTRSIRRATLCNFVTPVFCGSALTHMGVQPLMDGVVDFLPSPLEAQIPSIESQKGASRRKVSKRKEEQMNLPCIVDKSKGLIVNKNPGLTIALAFKVMTHATRGVLTFFRVYSGKLASNTTVLNTRTGKKLHFKKLMIMHGEDPEYVQFINAGNIGVIAGTAENIITGDTLVSHFPNSRSFSEVESNLKLHPIDIPPPLFNTTIEPLTAGDERYAKECILSLIREDPSLKVSYDEDMGQTNLSGMGELHLEIVKERLINDMKAKVMFRDVAVSYKETVAKPNYKSSAEQLNGSMVEIQLDSFEGDASDSEFIEEDGAYIYESENNIIILEPASISESMTRALEERRWKHELSLNELKDCIIQGAATALQVGGPILGFPLHSTVVRVKNWDFPVHNTEESPSVLIETIRRAINKNIENLGESAFTILEPIMKTSIYVNSDALGDVVHDLNHKRHAVIISIEDENSEGMEDQNWVNKEADSIYLPPDHTMERVNKTELISKKVITAHTALREMVGYLSKLRSITQGRSDFNLTYLGMKRALQSRLATIVQESRIL